VGRRRRTRGFGAGAVLRVRLVVVRDFDFVGIAVLPAETNPILLVDANAMLSATIADQTLKPVAGRDRELA
jgi:hypothetical protein